MNKETYNVTINKLLGKGFCLFPIYPNDKRPAVRDGCNEATNSFDYLQELISQQINYISYENNVIPNIGVEAKRSNLILIDVDNKDNRSGIENWNILTNGIKIDTLSATTPNDGLHFYFRRPSFWMLERSYIKDHKDIGAGIEIRINNSYLLCEPSQINGKQYKFNDIDKEIQEFPLELYNRILSCLAKETKVEINTNTDEPYSKYIYKPIEVINKFNEVNSIKHVLLDYGYREIDNDWLLHPTATSSERSVHILDNNMSYHFGASDPLGCSGYKNDGSLHSPYSAIINLKYDGDWKTALRAISKELGMDGLNTSETNNTESNKGAKPPEPVIHNIEPYDMGRLPCFVSGLANYIEEANDLLPYQNNIILGLAWMGGIVGKRCMCINKSNIYYPNVHVIVAEPSSTGKTGTWRFIYEATPAINKEIVGINPTIDSLLRAMGAVIPTKDEKNKVISNKERAERLALASQDAQKWLDSTMMIVDEVDGTLERLLGHKYENITTVVNSMTSGGIVEKSSETNGTKKAYDACLSIIGFTQFSVFEEKFNNKEMRNKGLISRFVVSNGNTKIKRIDCRSVSTEEIMNAINNTKLKLLEEGKEKLVLDWGEEKKIFNKKSMITIAKLKMLQTDKFRALESLVGDMEEMANKILVNGVKAAMAIKYILYGNGNKVDDQYLIETCLDLVLSYYYGYYDAINKKSDIDSEDRIVLSYIRSKGSILFSLLHKRFLRKYPKASDLWRDINSYEDLGLVKIIKKGKATYVATV